MSDVERVELEAAYVLHARPYRETSQLLEVVARGHGRLGLVARGARGRRPRWGSALQPFQPLRMSWSGRGTLCSLSAAELAAPAAALSGERLMSAYYVNELVLAFTTRGDPHPELFAHYVAAISGLRELLPVEPVLRAFELALLTETGYGLSIDREIESGVVLQPDQHYEYLPGRGPACAQPGDLSLTGAQLAAIAAGEFGNPEILRLAKRLLRGLLNYHLDGRPLRTRQVFAAMQR